MAMILLGKNQGEQSTAVAAMQKAHQALTD